MKLLSMRLFGLGLLTGILGVLLGCSLALPRLEVRGSQAIRSSESFGWFEGELLLGYEDESALRAMTARLGGRVIEEIPQIRAALVELPKDLRVPEAITTLLRERPRGLRYAEPNYIRTLIVPRPTDQGAIAQEASSGQLAGDPLRPRQWALDVMRAERAWERATGRGIIIGIVDTGMDGTHPELKGKQLPGMDCLTGQLHPPDSDSSQEWDIHATHVAGIAAAWGNNNEGIVGIAPDAQIMIVQIFNAKLVTRQNTSGYVGDARVAKCIVWASTMGPDGLEDSGDEAHVLNNSWGGRGYSQTLKDAIDVALENGVVFVNSMGNSYEDEVLYPKNYPGVLPVGATNPKDKKVDFSTMGANISVGAPGEDILSAWPLWDKKPTGEPYGYQYLSGTSMAAPQVSGALALLRELFPEATPYQLQKILERTADDIEQPGFDRKSGYGRINLAKATRTTRLPEDGAHVIIKVVTKNRADTNQDGIIDESDEQLGLPFVDVLLRQQGVERYFAQTNAQGEARFLGIEPGDYEVRVSGGDAIIYRYRLANRLTQQGQLRAVSGQTTQLTLEFNTRLKVSISWPEPVDIDLLMGEPRPGGGDPQWVSSKTDAQWGTFQSERNRESYTLSDVHYPDAVYPIAISAEHASEPANVTVVVEQNGFIERYGPFVLHPGQVLPSSEWYNWWENFPSPERGFEEKGPGGPWVY